MAKVLRWAGYIVGGLIVIAVGATLFVWAAADVKLTESDPQPERLATPTPAQLADGPRQLRVLGCLSCHGDTLQGDLFIDEPGIAKIYAPNLTQVAAKASDQQLAQAIQQGIGHDNRPLLIMPSGQGLAALLPLALVLVFLGNLGQATAKLFLRRSFG